MHNYWRFDILTTRFISEIIRFDLQKNYFETFPGNLGPSTTS